MFWVAVGGAVLGAFAGWIQYRPTDEAVLDTGSGDCPDYQRLTSNLSLNIGAGADTLTAATLHVELFGVLPPRPPADLDVKLQRPEGAAEWASCFIATDADIRSLSWSDGKLSADIALTPNQFGKFTNNVITTGLGKDHSAITVDLCAPPAPDWGVGEICDPGTDHQITVTVRSPVEFLSAAPFPNAHSVKDGAVDSTWNLKGPVPPIVVLVKVPFNITAALWSRNQGSSFAGPLADPPVTVDLWYIADVLGIWTALAVTAAVLWRVSRRGAPRGPPSTAALLSLLLAGLLLAFHVERFGTLAPPALSNGVIVVAVWSVLACIGARPTERLVICGLGAGALALLCFIAFGPQQHWLRNLVLLGLSAVLLAVVTLGARAFVRQASALATLLTDDRADASVAPYLRLVRALLVAAFGFALGFPVGQFANFGTYTGDKVELFTAQLFWSLSVYFRTPLGWATLAVTIGLIAAAFCTLPQRARRSSVACLLALMLALSAPWGDRLTVSLVVPLPVWLIQFAVLWFAFHRVIHHRRRRVPASPRSWRNYLLETARSGAGASDPPATDGHPLPRPASVAGARLLALGAHPGRRLGNARAAARAAGVLAVVPVGYLLWTVVNDFGSRLHANTDILTTALGGFLELVMWVVIGFVFGYLYPVLPGRIGPAKALVFSAFWVASCIGPFLVARAAGLDATNITIYRSAQVTLFVTALAVIIDLRTLKAANGTWRDLRTVYDVETYTELAALVAPAALVAATLAQQIATGAGSDVAATLLDSITGVLKVGPL